MPRRKTTTMRLDPELLEALQRGKLRDGVPISEQVRRAIQAWIEEKGLNVKTASRRARTRRKA